MAIRDPAAMPPPDAKPEYHNITAVITSIDSEQTMYYMAAPDTGRKVSAACQVAWRVYYAVASNAETIV